MRTEHPGIEGGLCGVCPAFLNREHQTVMPLLFPAKRESHSPPCPVSSPLQTVTMSQLSLSLSPPSVPPSGADAAGAGAIDAQVPVASAAVPTVASAAVPMLEVPKKKCDLQKMSQAELKTMCGMRNVGYKSSGKKGVVKVEYVDTLYTYANAGGRPPAARSGVGCKKSASVVGEEWGGKATLTMMMSFICSCRNKK
jgi:hypothetical protein